ncbi:MAG: 50S ribosomal protein L10 [Candidatus Omnitrophica bacterium]|nr:50S ribosomal protein L10 [Candidatus Omnitrophota bacterium]
MGRAEREYIVDEVSQRIKENQNLILSNFVNVKSEKLNELRTKLAENSGSYFVVKNTLCKLALKEAGLNQLVELVDGQMGLVLCQDDPVKVSKILIDFSKKADGLTVRGGYVEGAVISEAQIKELAALPSEKELLTMLVYGMKSPITSFVSLLGRLVQGLVVVLDQIAKNKGNDTVEEKSEQE